jgi:hypothetical protein
MTTGQIVAIVVLVVLVAAVVAAVMIFRRRSPDQRRLEAAQARREAEVHAASAERLEAEAEQRAERAKAEQAQAEELAEMARHDREVAREQQARAEKLDPDHAETVEAPAVHPDEQRPAVADRPSRQAYEPPEPIVAGAAAGMITPRQRAADESPTVPTAKDEAAPTTGPAAVPAQRSVQADDTAEDRPTVGEFVQGRSEPARGATDPADPATDQHHQRPARTLADRIMGRG